MSLELEVLDCELTVCKVPSLERVRMDLQPLFIGKTDEEISVVCPTVDVPEVTSEKDDGWRALRIVGKLDFSLKGILSGISEVLAENDIGIFAVSTFNTDYILVKAYDLEDAINALKDGGYVIR